MTTADEDWAAEIDEQERQISGEVSYCHCVMGNQGKMWEIRRFVLEFKAPYFFLNSYI